MKDDNLAVAENELEIMSGASLTERLERVRVAIDAVKRRDVSNVVFMNIDGFANFVDDTSGEKKPLFTRTLTELEPYIPLILSDDNMRFFLEVAMSNDADLIRELERAIINDAKAQFVNSVYNATTDAAWNDIKKTCETIRIYRQKIG